MIVQVDTFHLFPYNIRLMSKALVVVGRVIFSVLLFVSAYVHLEHPDFFLDFYTKTYGVAHDIALQYSVELPATDYVGMYIYTDEY